ncbi:MAG: multicopper oxidase family protein [Actinomycetes bacterium]
MGTGLLAVVLLGVGWAWWGSRLPAAYSSESMGVADFGGGPGSGDGHHAGGHGAAAASVTDFVADASRAADVRVGLVARAERITLPGGQTFEGYTLNGQTPGPTLRARQGDLVEVEFRNESVPGGATLHWHGLDVPNAMDGVAGVTQDAVAPGATFVYRFVAEQAGTFWYHSHQISHAQVLGGLFGALVIEPSTGQQIGPEALLVLHTYPGTSRMLNGRMGDVPYEAHPGDLVRVRVINTDNAPTVVWVPGARFRLLAIDGTEVNGPTDVADQKVTVTAGGRVDLEVRVPDRGAVRVQAPGAALVLGPEGATAPGGPAPAAELDPLSYGSPAPLGFDPTTADRRFDYGIGRFPGFLDGRPGYWWTINGRMGKDVPMFMVREGDVATMRISNQSGEVHPMHLHGHHVVVLARDGVPATGSPWWVDSLNVEHGQSYDVAFVADNPGIWMDHCHNLPHAAEGLMTHLMYEGVGTPYLMGVESGNEPE